MDKQQILIVTQVVLKGFIEQYKKLPEEDTEFELIKDTVYKIVITSENAYKQLATKLK